MLNFSGLVFMLPLGLGMAITICVGQLVGRSDLHGAVRIGFTGIFLCLSVSIVSASLTLCFAEKIIALYTEEPDIIGCHIITQDRSFSSSGGRRADRLLFLERNKRHSYSMILNGFNYWVIGWYSLSRWDKARGGTCWYLVWDSPLLVLAGLALVWRFHMLTKSMIGKLLRSHED